MGGHPCADLEPSLVGGQFWKSRMDFGPAKLMQDDDEQRRPNRAAQPLITSYTTLSTGNASLVVHCSSPRQ